MPRKIKAPCVFMLSSSSTFLAAHIKDETHFAFRTHHQQRTTQKAITRSEEKLENFSKRRRKKSECEARRRRKTRWENRNKNPEMMMMKVQKKAENCERFLTFFNVTHTAVTADAQLCCFRSTLFLASTSVGLVNRFTSSDSREPTSGKPSSF